VRTTDSRHAYPIAPNILERDFAATAPDQKWLADMTYVPTAEGWLYLALVLDLFARKIVGWAMSDTMPQELTIEALQVALGWRDPPMAEARSPLVAYRWDGEQADPRGSSA
jgi:transposase InsO family protein